MVQFRPKSRELIAKVVYYGPPLGGKTTNLRSIYAGYPPDTRGELIIVPAGTDRTIFFDFLPVELGTLRGMRVRVQLYTVPGQVRYNATRQVVLRGVDGVVFVADSQRALLANNRESWDNLKDNLLLQGVNLAELAHVVQYNKRDLRDIASIEQLDELLNEYNAPFYEAVASEGIGVEETLQGMVKLVVRSLRERFRLDGEQALTQPIHMGVREVERRPGAGPAPGEVTTGFALVGTELIGVEPGAGPQAPPDRVFAPPFDAEITQVTPAGAQRDELRDFGGGLAAQWAALEAKEPLPAVEVESAPWPLEEAPAVGGPASAAEPVFGAGLPAGSRPAFEGAPPDALAAAEPPRDLSGPGFAGLPFEEPGVTGGTGAEAVSGEPFSMGPELGEERPFEGMEAGETRAPAVPGVSSAAAPGFGHDERAGQPPLFGPAAALSAIDMAVGGGGRGPIGDELDSLVAVMRQEPEPPPPVGASTPVGPPPPAWPAPASPAVEATTAADRPLLPDLPAPGAAVAPPAPLALEPAWSLPAAPAEPFVAEPWGGTEGFMPAVPAGPSTLEGASAAAPGADEPFQVPDAPLPAGGDVFAIVPAPPAQVAVAAPAEYEPETVVVPVEISAVRRLASRALAQVGEVRELELEVPVPAVWIGGRRMTLQVRLTLVPREEDDER